MQQRNGATAAASVALAGLLAACAPHEDRPYFNAAGDHASPPGHLDIVAQGVEAVDEEPVRVRDAAERARMERYIAEFADPGAVVATIELADRELVDCFPIDKQPALRRRELRGLVPQPATPPDPGAGIRADPGTVLGDPSARIRLEAARQEYGTAGKICPERSVPIRSLTMEILDNFETLEDFLQARPPHDLTGSTASHQYAYSYIMTENWGSQSTLNVWSTYTERADEFSLSQITVTRGTGADKETVEAGWQTYRDLYGDYTPRLFIFFTPDNYGQGGCYNLTCGAFVQVNNSIYIGGGFTDISGHPHPSTAWEFTIRWQRHGETGDWWLKYGDTWVGYYPSRLFDDNGLRPRGSKASFYGEIVDKQPGGRHTQTDMGSGHFPGDGFGYAAYQRRIRTITTGNVWNTHPALDPSATDANCYDIEMHDSAGDWERYFYFGGPGWNHHCR